MKVVVIKIAAIGDFLMATPALRALKKDSRTTELILIAGRSLEPVVRHNRSVDRVHWLDDAKIFKGSAAAKGAEVLRMARILRRERCDIGFNFHRDWRYNLILVLAGIKRRVGFSRPRRTWFLTDPVTVRGTKHHIFHYCDLVKAAGALCLDFAMEFDLPGMAGIRESDFPAVAALGRYVALCSGGAVNVKESMESRRWGAARYGRLVSLLRGLGIPVVLVGSSGDVGSAGELPAGDPGIVDLMGKTTLAQAAALLQGAAAAVTNDSGLMHLAAAVRTRVIALFGPTHPDEKKPLNAGSLAIWKGESQDCSPCYRDGSFPECSHLRCFEAITPEEVLTAVQNALNPNAPARGTI